MKLLIVFAKRSLRIFPMNIRVILLLVCMVIGRAALAQTATELVLTGRDFLSKRDLTNANSSFRAAVVANPSDQKAQALYGITRVLTLVYQPEVSALLDRLGMSKTNRSLYSWRATIPTDTNHIPFAPPGLSAAEGVNLIKAKVLPEINA